MARKSLSRPILTLVLVLLAAFWLASPAFGQGSLDERYVTVGSHYFMPSAFTFQVGQHVRFHVANSSLDHLHDFLIVPESSRAIVGGHPGAIRPGEHVTVDWTPTAPGTYLIVCATCPAAERMIIAVQVV